MWRIRIITAFRKVVFGSSSTTITTVAGNGEQLFSGDNAAATLAGLDSPNGIAVDAAGKIYIGDTHNQRVRVVDTTGVISTLAGNGSKTYAGDGAAATSASLARPRGLSVDALGNIYVADSDNNRIRLIAKTGTITTLAGNGSQGFTGDGGPAVDATLDTPRATAVAATGVVAFSDTHNQRVREVSADGSINTIAGLSPTAGGASIGESLVLNGTSSVVYGSGSLTMTFSNMARLRRGMSRWWILRVADRCQLAPRRWLGTRRRSTSQWSRQDYTESSRITAGTRIILASPAGSFC